MSTTKLDQLYELRTNFSVIGITGRTGSGCSEIAELLSAKFDKLDKIREVAIFQESIFKRKFEIVYNFTKENWQPYKVIEYKKVLLLLLIPYISKNIENKHLNDFYRTSLREETDRSLISKIELSIKNELKKHTELIEEINSLDILKNVLDNEKLKLLSEIFWGKPFNALADQIDTILSKNGIIERVMLLHHTANNFRKSGQPFKSDEIDPQYIYTIAEAINKIIKAIRYISSNKECRIVIDSLRNSLEINFFKERYSAFYLVAVKHDKRKTNLLLKYNLNQEKIVDFLLEFDEVEYRCNDFQKGLFYAPDVQNCIQKADYHINNNHYDSKDVFLKDSSSGKFNYFFSIDEQLMKLQGLIQQPGLITPDSAERIMQIAYTAKLNSGCISRQVGAVVTDNEFSTKAIGWNDVPKNAIPCSLRNVKELNNSTTPFGFTQFEIGEGLKETENVNATNSDNEKDKESKDFYEFVKANYNEKTLPASKLGGINCPYCFKTAYNAFSGDKNQVHTRSLHAEENAMMQISKYGGQGLNKGYLFTTASPCELCAKKAYQLGITTIYYIDPYPGISRNHILKSNPDKDPKMVVFSGAVGRAYFKLYEPFLAQKDELAILTDFKIDSPQKIKTDALRKLLSKSFENKLELKDKLDKLLSSNEKAFDEIVSLIEKGLTSS
jgi:deoxycytidylate deaminase